MNKWLNYLISFLITFLACAFATTVSVLVLTNGTSSDLRILKDNALQSFISFLLASLLISSISNLTLYLQQVHIVKKIRKGVEEIAGGNFSYRIDNKGTAYRYFYYSDIIDCINRMAEELEANVMLSSDFVANVSHELKTPLSAISANCMLLQDPSLGEKERQERISQTLKSVENLSTLISNVLKLNKLEHQTIFPKTNAFNLSAQLEESLLSFEEIWEKKNLEVEFQGEEDIFITSDEELLSLVWHNLISNAIKFTEAKGKVLVTLNDFPDHVSVQIEDNGCGISSSTGMHIFDKFYQGDTSHQTEGNGLGLCLVKRVIDILDAKIELTSAVGRGTTFTVILDKEKDQ